MSNMETAYENAIECECFITGEYCYCEEDCECGCEECDCGQWELVLIDKAGECPVCGGGGCMCNIRAEEGGDS